MNPVPHPLSLVRRNCLRWVATLGGLALLPAARAAAARGPALLLARDAPADLHPHGWLVSEKYDGVRALWDGERLVLRGGGAIHAPTWFTAGWPDRPLDGELWLGRGRFEATAGLVRRALPREEGWRALRYMCFELPGAPGPFSERVMALRQVVQACPNPALVAVAHHSLPDHAALQRLLAQVLAEGGEGLALHRADAPYATGRTGALLKFKPLADAEATVVAHEPGQGRLTGLMGALRVRDERGLEFRIGTGFSDHDRAHPPALGSRVTYAYRGRTALGVPRFASFVRRAPLL